MKTLLFCDSDKDDLYSLTILIAQCYHRSIEIIGIVCDDGFLSYPQNISIMQFWIQGILKFQGIDLFRGVDRNAYLKQQNHFPKSFISSYIDMMTNRYGYDPTMVPSYLTLDQLMLKIDRYGERTIAVLTTGNLTTLSHLIRLDPKFENKLKSIHSMIGNYTVDGNVVAASKFDPTIVANSEYNAFLDPDSFSHIVRSCGDILYIIPLDCTNYAPLTRRTLERLNCLGSKYYNESKNDFTKNIYTQFIRLLGDTLITINTRLYMWDIVATMLFLDKPMDQQYIVPNIAISWTGRIVDDLQSNRSKLFNQIDYDKLLNAIIDGIFFPNSQIINHSMDDNIQGTDELMEYYASTNLKLFSRHHC